MLQALLSPRILLPLLGVWSGLLVTLLQGVALFHSLAELASAAVAWSFFLIAWNTRDLQQNPYVLHLGMAALAVGLLDTLHALAYPGMAVLGRAGGRTSSSNSGWPSGPSGRRPCSSPRSRRRAAGGPGPPWPATPWPWGSPSRRSASDSSRSAGGRGSARPPSRSAWISSSPS